MLFGFNFLKYANNILRSKLATTTFGLSEIYKPAATRGQQKITDLLRRKAEEASKSDLARKMRVAKGFTLEMAPPTSREEFRQLKSDFKSAIAFMKSGGFNNLTVRQAWLLLLVALEVGLWFFIGETIGKFHIVGYSV